jgi:hypothetical protein
MYLLQRVGALSLRRACSSAKLVSAGNHQEEMVLLREEYEVNLASRTTQMNLAIIRMNAVGAENAVNAQRIQFLEEQVQLLQGRVHSFQSYQTDAPGF